MQVTIDVSFDELYSIRRWMNINGNFLGSKYVPESILQKISDSLKDVITVGSRYEGGWVLEVIQPDTPSTKDREQLKKIYTVKNLDLNPKPYLSYLVTYEGEHKDIIKRIRA